MYSFKPWFANIYKRSKFPEGDDTESMEATVRVYSDNVYLGFVIHAVIKNGGAYFEWNNKRFDCLRNSAFEVITQSYDYLDDNSEKDELDGIAHNILASLLRDE